MNVSEMFPAKWLQPSDLRGRSIVVAVKGVDLVQVFDPRERRQVSKLAVSFTGAKKRMLLNKTQALAMATVCCSTETDDWVGQRIQLSVGIAPNRSETIVVSVPAAAETAIAPTGAAETPPAAATTEAVPPPTKNGRKGKTAPAPLPPDPSGNGTAHTGRYAEIAADGSALPVTEPSAGPPDLPVIEDDEADAVLDPVTAGDFD